MTTTTTGTITRHILERIGHQDLADAIDRFKDDLSSLGFAAEVKGSWDDEKIQLRIAVKQPTEEQQDLPLFSRTGSDERGEMLAYGVQA